MLPDFIKEPSDLSGYYVYIELYIPCKGHSLSIELSYSSNEEIYELMECSDVRVDGYSITIVMDAI